MRNLLIILLSWLVFIPNLNAQNSMDNILNEVEKNNTTLLALRKSFDAEMIGNKTGIYLQNPEFEFHYLWANPDVIGNRTDISITQSFDFPSAYSHKKQISNIRNEQVELEYQKQRRDLLLKTRLLCYDLVYVNALKSELSKRMEHSKSIAKAYQKKFDLGESNILEYNKAQLNLLNLSKELESLEIKKEALLAELMSLNGGIPLTFTDSVFQPEVVPADFETWYLLAEQNNPMLNWLKQEVEINRQQEKLNRAMSLPKLNAGYMSEKFVGEKFQGVTVGLAIPLFENKNTVKYAKANSLAIESIKADKKLQFYNQLKALHAKATGLQKNVDGYRADLLKYDNTELLKKALDKGQITLIEYMLELSIYYESVNLLLEMERELNGTLAELKRYM